MKKVALYTTPTCTYCRSAKQFFQENNIQYDEYNVAVDIGRREEMFKKSEQMGVPVIAIAEPDGSGEKIIVGFERRALASALGLV